MSESTNDLDDETGSPWTQKGFVASAVVVGLLVVLGAVLVFTGPSDKDDRAVPGPQPTTSTEPRSTSTTSPPADASACGLPDGDQSVPRTAPIGTKWELIGTMAAPTGPTTHGPGEVHDGVRSCFAHSPTGALYAAANVAALMAVPELRERAVKALGAEGAGRDHALQQLTNDKTAATSGVQVAGFTVLNYDLRSTTVDIAVRAITSAGQAGSAHVPVTLRWEQGDWKVVFAADGSLGTGTGPIPDLTGYVPWAGA